jgi:hypothetical protein
MMDVVETKDWINGQLVQILMRVIKQRNGYLEAYHEEFVVLWVQSQKHGPILLELVFKIV